MSKIICDICGTTYPDTAEQCPICGCTRDSAAALLGDDFLQEEIPDDDKGKGGRFTAKKKKEIFDYDEVNADKVDAEDEQNPYEEEDEYEEAPKTSVGWVIVLTILIVALLGAAGFIFMRFILPNLRGEEPAPAVESTVQTTEAPFVLDIPCQDLIMTSGKVAELNGEGQYFMLHVIASPADTTDPIVYESSDTGIVTVTEDGKLTAVSEGEATIYITCGDFQLTCDVVCRFVEETLPPVTEATIPAETEAEETVDGTTGETADETVEGTEAENEETEEAKPTDPNKADVILKLKKTDISLAVFYQFTLELDCDLKPEDVEWRSEHSHIATVDEKGVVTAKKTGTTAVIAKYGDQEVQCIIRCYK